MAEQNILINTKYQYLSLILHLILSFPTTKSFKINILVRMYESHTYLQMS